MSDTHQIIDHETGELLDPANMNRGDWERCITARWQDAVDSILDVGRMLVQAKDALPHGEFGELELPFTDSTKQRLMAIARHPILSNAAHVQHLPPSWGTLYELTKLPEDFVTDRLESGELNAGTERSDVRQWQRDLKRGEKVEPPLLEGQYRVIYADPPWSYDNSGFKQSAAEHYPTMAVEEICDLPVSDLAGEPSVLYLWATSPLLPDAIAVMEAWGFEYRAHRIWHKDRAPGLGWWLNTQHELLLIGTANGIYHPAERLPSIVFAPVERHSKKPECFRQDIEAVHDGPYIELFARETAPGWTVWGNEDV